MVLYRNLMISFRFLWGVEKIFIISQIHESGENGRFGQKVE
jgi:hypothetical protein